MGLHPSFWIILHFCTDSLCWTKWSQTQSILLLAFFLSLPIALLSQEEVKEKKVTVKTIKEVNGKKIVKDTTFVVSDDEDVNED